MSELKPCEYDCLCDDCYQQERLGRKVMGMLDEYPMTDWPQGNPSTMDGIAESPSLSDKKEVKE